MFYAVLFFVAAALVVSLTPLVRQIAYRWDFLDLPEIRKIHKRPTPLLGGLAIMAGFLAAFLVGVLLHRAEFTFPIIGFLFGALWIFLLGLLDDKIGLGPLTKLLGQVLACSFLFFSGNTNGLITSAPLDLFFSFIWVVGLMNAINFLDNMDGLATGITFVAAIAFFILFVLHGQVVPAMIAIGLAGSAIAFLVFNFHPASIFLGDSGSLLFGYILATLGIMSTWHQDSYLYLLVPVLILGYPIFDVSFVVLTRLARGTSVAEPGKDHSTHRLETLLANVRGTAGVVYGICLMLATVGICLSFTRELSIYMAALLLAAGISLSCGALLSRVPIQGVVRD